MNPNNMNRTLIGLYLFEDTCFANKKQTLCVCVCVCVCVCGVVWCGVVWCGVVWCGVCVCE